MPRVTGAVILFNPSEEVVNNILSYLNQLDCLWLIDNSDDDNSRLFESIDSANIFYMPNYKNLGIAAALNLAAEKAIKENYEYLLTMDQDSLVSENYVCEMLKIFNDDRRIGILSPFIIHPANPKKPKNIETEEITVAMTSGSIIKLSVYKEAGKFLEFLFIDYVDHEYCLRVNSAGYKVVQLNSVFLYHKLGEIRARNFIFKKAFPSNHSPIRIYYRTRNRFYVYKKYKKKFPAYIKSERIVFLKELLKILFYEKNRIKKLKMIFLGYYDYINNTYGEYNKKFSI